METVYRDYSSKGVNFYYIYKALAHPEHNGYVKPFTLKERLMHVKEAQRTLGSQIPWICDSMDNELKHALGNRPNSGFLIDPDGKAIRSRSWSKPGELRKDLEELVGPIEKPTTVAELNLKIAPPPKVAASGIVKRISRSGGMRALKIEPTVKAKGLPFYAKLRAEGDSGLQRGGKGKLYLGFHLDPIYHVHWNNLTPPIKVTIETPEGISATPKELIGPKLKEPADIDPREFLVDVDADGAKGPIKLTVSYFACNDEEGWCKPVTQKYVVYLETDRDGGSARSRGGQRGRPPQSAGRGPGGGRPPGGGFPGGGFPGGRPPFGGAQGGPPLAAQIADVDVKKGTILVILQNGEDRELRVPKDTRIMRNSQRSGINSLKVGDVCRIQIQQSGNGPATVQRMMVIDDN